MNHIVASVLTLTILSACSGAKSVSDVTAAYIPSSQYKNLSCEALLSEAERARQSITELAAAVEKHRKKQTNVEVVTWVLFWPAALALNEGEELSDDLAQAKGRLEALNAAYRLKKC